MAKATLCRRGTVVTAEAETRADLLLVGELVAAVRPDVEALSGTLVVD
jgi:hypothetical protein